jgi:hypothetical protein
MASDDLGVLLKEAQQLLGSLDDTSLHQRHEVLELLRQKAPGPTIIGVLSQRFYDPYRLSTARLGDRN